MANAKCLTLACLILCVRAFSEEPSEPARKSPPNQKEQEKQRRVLRETFKDKFSTKKPEDALKLARELLKFSEEITNDDLLYTIYEDVVDLAVQGGDLKTASDAIDKQEKRFQHPDPLARRERVLKGFSKMAGVPNLKQQLVLAGIRLVEDCFAGENPVIARSAAKIALESARSFGDPRWIEVANVKAQEVDDFSGEFRKKEAAEKLLTGDPENPDAKVAKGRYLCFAKGEWKTGLELLAKSPEASIASLAKRDIASPNIGDERLTLADDWLKLSEDERKRSKKAVLVVRRLEDRAAHWYELTLGMITGLERVRAEKIWVKLSRGKIKEVLKDAVLFLTLDQDTINEEKGKKHIRDLSGKNNHGIIYWARTTPGKIGEGLSFDGQRDYVKAATACSDLPPGNSERTLVAWVRTTNQPGTTRHIVCYGNGNKDSTHFFLALEAGGGVLLGPSGKGLIFCNHPVNDGEWHHLAGVYQGDQTIGVSKIYIDGREALSRTVDIKLETESRDPWYLGEGPRRGKIFQGEIDEVMVLTRALNAEEVFLIYTVGKLGFSLSTAIH